MRKQMTLWPNSARWVGAVVGSGLCLALLASPARAGEQVVAEGLIGDEVSAYGGTVAFSEQEGRDRWRLKLWRAGQIRTLAIRPKRVPFDDVDLGPGQDGGLTVVYSRCRVEPRDEDVGRGCDLFRYSHGQERRVAGVSRRGYSEHHPSIWRSRVAFGRAIATRAPGSLGPIGSTCARRAVCAACREAPLRPRMSRIPSRGSGALICEARGWRLSGATKPTSAPASVTGSPRKAIRPRLSAVRSGWPSAMARDAGSTDDVLGAIARSSTPC